MNVICSVLQRFFKLDENATSISKEIVAGITTFVTMAYVMAVMPAILANTGMPKEAVFLATCLGSGLVTIVIGLLVNLPVALAPGMGLGAYFVVVASTQGGVPWPIALGAVFISGIIFFILTVTNIRQILIEAIPDSLKQAVIIGIGFFITLIGLKISHLVVVNVHLAPSFNEVITSSGVAKLSFFEWDLSLGDFSKSDTLLTLIGLIITSILVALRVSCGILLGIIITTVIGIPLGLTNIHDVNFSLPSISDMKIGALDIKSAWSVGLASVIFTFIFVGLMDTFGTLVSIADKIGITTKKNGNGSKLIGKAMLVDSIGTCFGAFLGIPGLIVYLESMAGITAGGRTGLTAVTTGILFLLSILLSSFFILIPTAATAPILILIGVYMIASVHNVDFEDFTEAFPAFLTIIIMPFTYSVANGISVGIVFYVLLKLVTGKWSKIHWMMYVLTCLIISKFTFFN